MPSLTKPVKTPNLSVVVLAWNKLELTRRCVDSIRSGTSGDYELIVVDNGSTDGGAEYATAAADKAVINSENLGFAAGNNSGLAVATGTYVAFVNNDTVLPGGMGCLAHRNPRHAAADRDGAAGGNRGRQPGDGQERARRHRRDLASLWRVPQRRRGGVEEIPDGGVGRLERGI